MATPELCYRPHDFSDKIDIITFYIELSSIFLRILKRNFQIIGKGITAHIGKDNKNGEYLADFSREDL